MKILGSLLILLGIAAIVITQVELALPGVDMANQWINNWGMEIGWAIRGGLIVLGLLLWVVGSMGGSKSPA